ncbi:helix-turn-helix transcriptional regulator [Brevibacillus centrosporus]|uniref:helix-turn-helix transcriptional regulator n=1 Tax=Brevibacillus centrosporus TaxID=54910 RepID=UPI003827CA1F
MSKRTNLVSRRKQLGFLQKDIAEQLGCSTSAYGMYETGARTPDLNTAKQIADILKTTVEEIFFEDTNNKSCYFATEPA